MFFYCVAFYFNEGFVYVVYVAARSMFIVHVVIIFLHGASENFLDMFRKDSCIQARVMFFIAMTLEAIQLVELSKISTILDGLRYNMVIALMNCEVAQNVDDYR